MYDFGGNMQSNGGSAFPSFLRNGVWLNTKKNLDLGIRVIREYD